MAIDVGESLTRKIGPLPVWGWGVALGGGLLVWRFVAGGDDAVSEPPEDGEPVFAGGPQIPSDLLTDIAVTLRGIEENTKPAIDETPTGEGNGEVIQPPPASGGVRAEKARLQEQLWRILGSYEDRRRFARRHKRDDESIAESWTRLYGQRGWGFKQLTGTAPKPPSRDTLRRLIGLARAQ